MAKERKHLACDAASRPNISRAKAAGCFGEEARPPSEARATLLKLVHLNERHPRRIADASNYRGVCARRESPENGTFKVVRRRNGGCYDFAFLIAAPVVIRRDQRAVAIMQIERRVL